MDAPLAHNTLAFLRRVDLKGFEVGEFTKVFNAVAAYAVNGVGGNPIAGAGGHDFSVGAGDNPTIDGVSVPVGTPADDSDVEDDVT